MISFDSFWGPAVAEKAGTYFNPDCDVAVVNVRVLEGGFEELLGGAIFQNYTVESIAIHVASWHPGWLTRELLFHVFGYAFLQLEVGRIFGQVPADLPEVLNFDLHLGFKEIARIPKVFKGGVDDIVVCMEKKECRFLRKPKSCSPEQLAA